MPPKARLVDIDQRYARSKIILYPGPKEKTLKRTMLAILTLAATFSLGTPSFAQREKADVGKLEFEVHCAICHGIDAKGNGPYVSNLKLAPPDLTLIARNNKGVFPADHIIGVIDGRAQITSHGSRDMPIWGNRYAVSAAEHFAGSPYDQEAFIRGRVLILVDYLRRIQQQ
jgi:mono/diheme cytochrome c family protein